MCIERHHQNSGPPTPHTHPHSTSHTHHRKDNQ
nr:MAG TPA: hypothetical protein [Caudoviricetes sp.]